MTECFLVGFGGFLGSLSRYAIGLAVRNYTSHPFPIATLVVNTFGCVAIGFLFEFFREHQWLPTLQLLISIGFLGAFTTFSAFSFETLTLVRNGTISLALLNIFGNLFLCFLGAIFGSWLGNFFS